MDLQRWRRNPPGPTGVFNVVAIVLPGLLTVMLAPDDWSFLAIVLTTVAVVAVWASAVFVVWSWFEDRRSGGE